ncbi:Tyrosine-protein kinase EpsD [Acidisarcina polymorpha]|uniref:Tyrosine-protein kinase EpsD n=1 Tax=Acidisarcina polymorpha TaxID=2211140 RepID=A0A2Z5G1F6_9BACT|nr:polysaccharide biosynthesis tyrosine autokinase [Acidisarcina polymorpha]AXC12931.1 Tyrosine-protein kinase EpsD [Acidisarcina polymorpha]
MNTVPEKDLNLRDFLKVFDRRRSLIFRIAAVIFVVAVLACIFMTREYTATGVIQLDKTASDGMGLENLMGSGSAGAVDALTLNIELETTSDILQSEGLALKVINDLNLENNEDFKPHFNPIGWVMGLVSPGGPADPANASLENSPGRRRRVLRVWAKYLKVKVNAGTRLIDVGFTNRDPKVAAAVVNHLTQALMDYEFQTRVSATNAVSQGLEGQLAGLRKHSEDLQAKVVALQQTSGLFGVTGTDAQGNNTVTSPALQNLDKSTAQLSQATMNRVLKQAVYDVVRTGDPEAISQLSGTQMSAEGGQGVMNSLSLIQSLRQQESSLQGQIEQESTKFGPAYPRLIQDKASLAAVQQSLKDEIARIAGRAKADYEVAVRAEEGAKQAYDSDRGAAEKLNSQGVEYQILSKEADQSQQLYQDLLKRLKEAGIVQGLRSSDLTIVDTASPPAKPSKPNVPLYLALGLVGGFFLGGCAALLIDALDGSIQGTEDIEAMNLPVLGLVPQIKLDEAQPGKLLLDSEYSVYGEAVRGLRSTLLESHSGKQAQVLLVTSSSPREGKSALALNLAVSQAQFKKKVLLVEADMRRPVLRKILGLSGTEGLSDLLGNPEATVAPQILPDHMNLHCLPAGPIPAHPAEMLGSERMQFLMREWRRDYDFIVLDCPPVLPVTDAQYLEGMADATFLVARAGSTSKIALQRAYQLLYRHVKDPQNPRIGVVLNFISLRSAAYYGYYGYRGDPKYEYEKVGTLDK